MTNHPHLSILISFIFMDTNNRMIANHTHISIKDNTSSEKSASCYSILSTVTYNYTYEDTPVRTRIKKTPRKTAIWISLLFMSTSIISMHTYFVTSLIKTPHTCENITTFPHNSNEEIVWGHSDNTPYPRELFASTLSMHCCTSTPQRTSKILNSSHV